MKMSVEKRCVKCRDSLSVSEFHKDRSRNDGLANICKPCSTKKAREYSQRPEVKERDNARCRSEEYKAKKRAWLRTEEGRALARERKRRYHSTEKGKASRAKAHRKLRQKPEIKMKDNVGKSTRAAIKSGKITRLPCRFCGALEVEAHHMDYSKRLDVIFLCQPHHRSMHQFLDCL